jgi:hypothetical protein
VFRPGPVLLHPLAPVYSTIPLANPFLSMTLDFFLSL